MIMKKGGSSAQFCYLLKSKETKLKQGISEDSIVDLVDSVLYKAIDLQASDIHLEPSSQQMRIRYRIDGILYNQKPVSCEQSLLALSRLKVLTSLDIAERRIPQDGKLIVNFCLDSTNNDVLEIRKIDLRVSTFPTTYGEKMVVRILDQSQQNVSLDTLGCSEYVFDKVSKLIERPHGFFLVTGPTGSGKTTTLYSILSKLNKSERNIVTMEDPVEYHIDGITQSQINEKAGFTFEKGLRSLLRQDPDVEMVGEIRDKQTAQIAIESALTGHFVLSSLHTNDSVGAVTRLIDMGIEPFLITASLTGVLAQRLSRKLCSYCKESVALSDTEKKLIEKYQWKIKKLFKAKGCKKCLGLGYKGRVGIFELLLLNDNLRNLLLQKVSKETIKAQAISDGMSLLQDDGIEKVKNGIISLEEFLRVIVIE